MRRYYLKRDDRSNAGGVVMEGEPSCMHYGTPFTYIGAKVFCPACKTTGRIAAKWPRLSDSMMGREAALEGDICLCACHPPPRMIASQHDSFQEIEVEEKTAARPADAVQSEPIQTESPAPRYAQRVQVRDSSTGMPLRHQPYRVEVNGAQTYGRTDEEGVATIETDAPSAFRIHIVFAAPKRALTPSQGD